MKTADVKKLSLLDQFLYWVKERHQIYLGRQKGHAKPWTDDEIFQSVYFTNPYREHDKVTVWYNQNLRTPLDGDPRLVFATIAFRWFNLPSTGDLLLGRNMEGWKESRSGHNLLLDWDAKDAIGRLCAAQNEGHKVFTGAYMIPNGGVKMPKIPLVCEGYIQPAWEATGPDRMKGWLTTAMLQARDDGELTLAHVHNLLKRLPGMGGSGFLAAQVVADLKYSRLYGLAQATDWWSWCSPGPGSVRGLNVLSGRDRDARVGKDFVERVNWLRGILDGRLKEFPPFHAQDVQNCLCEFSKYHAALNGLNKGGPKRRYPGV